MMEPDLQEHLQKLRCSLERLKALRAWQQVKQDEIASRHLSVFPMPDATAEQLRNEYALCIALAAGLRSTLNNQSIRIPETIREQFNRQLVEIDQEIHTLDPCGRPGGLGR